MDCGVEGTGLSKDLWCGSIISIKLNKHTAFSEKSNYSASGVHGTGYGVDLEARMNMSWWRDVLV